MTSPWHPTDASVAATVGKYTSGHTKTYMLLLDPAWKAPTGDTYRFVTLTSPNEMTCLVCGETFPAGGYCERCGIGEDGSTRFPAGKTPAVRTLEYLQEGEYRL